MLTCCAAIWQTQTSDGAGDGQAVTQMAGGYASDIVAAGRGDYARHGHG